MTPILLYCIAVFVILILYYFYKPSDESTTSKSSTTASASNLSTPHVAATTAISCLSYIDYDAQNILTECTNNYNIYANIRECQNYNEDQISYEKPNDEQMNVTSSRELTDEQAFNNYVLVSQRQQTDSISSFDTNFNETSSNILLTNSKQMNRNANRRQVFLLTVAHFCFNMKFKFIKFYNSYLLAYLLPFYKYLGLREPFGNFNRLLAYKLQQHQLTQSNFNFGEDMQFRTFDDLLLEFNRLEIFSSALSSSNGTFSLSVGIDFTASNEWKGRKSFNSQSLHKIFGEKTLNPYQRVLSTLNYCLTKILSACLINQTDTNGYYKIYAYGFGDSFTTDKSVFSLAEPWSNSISFDSNHFDSLDDVLTRYGELTRRISFSGPTSFAPLIHKTIELLKHEQKLTGKINFHILFILTDGTLSTENEKQTIKAIQLASSFALSIICIGVGDGPWTKMIKFENNVNTVSKFDNFHFVNYNFDYNANAKLNAKASQVSLAPSDLTFAFRVFGKIPKQHKLMKKFNYI